VGAEIDGKLPAPASERGSWALAAVVALLGAGTLTAVLTGLVGSRRDAPPALPARAIVPAPAASSVNPATGRRLYGASTTAGSRHAAIVSQPPQGTGATGAAKASADLTGGVQDQLEAEVPRSWIEGFYPVYETAQKTFGVNWLLIASIHDQETAFSTASGTYHGLNFAHCCGGPMQFNVTNGGAGAPSSWDLVKGSYLYAPRPAHYDHATERHPSIYDDFDAIMAAAHLLQLDGASYALNDSAWWAAYDYYGHDAYGVTYADQVLARAIGWSQHGFCANCGVSTQLVDAVQAAYGAAVAAQIEAEAQASARARAAKRRRRSTRQPARSARRRRGR
jgi:hypothetical protein